MGSLPLAPPGKPIQYTAIIMYQALAEDFPVAQLAKNLPMMQETRVRFLGQEDPLEKEMAVHSSILAWRSPWTEKSGGLQFMGHKEWDTTERLTHTHTHARARAHMHTHTRLRGGNPEENKPAQSLAFIGYYCCTDLVLIHC